MGEVKILAGLYLDGLILVRLIVARIMGTKGRGWYTYPILIILSFVVIPSIFG
jgi:hypothetical protein